MTLPSALYDQRLKASHVRTRRPLSLYYTEAVPSGSQDIPDTTAVVAGVASGDLVNALSAPPATGKNGYGTGNASHLHLSITHDAADETLTLYGYNYALKAWGKMYIPVGVKNGADTTAELAYVAATFATINGTKLLTVPIHGVDRIAFVVNEALDAISAAVSTF